MKDESFGLGLVFIYNPKGWATDLVLNLQGFGERFDQGSLASPHLTFENPHFFLACFLK